MNDYQKICIGIGLFSFLLLSGCGVIRQANPFPFEADTYEKLSDEDKKMADTLLKYAMENEGLYTLIGGLKPMSTVYDLSFSLAQTDSAVRGSAEVSDVLSKDYQRLLGYQRVVNALQFGDVQFILYPFRIHQKGRRNASINVYRKSLVDSMLSVNASFYGQFAITPGTPVPLVIGLTEYEKSDDRFRSYGHLFGYPLHAVNFFVKAAIHQEDTREFVQRDFFQIPVFSRETGRFVYAIPKDSLPKTADLVIRERSVHALKRYKLLREKYTDHEGKVAYYQLFIRLLEQNDGIR